MQIIFEMHKSFTGHYKVYKHIILYCLLLVKYAILLIYCFRIALKLVSFSTVSRQIC